MITKEELKRYGELKSELEDLKERIVRAESEIQSAKIQVITGMPHGGSGEMDSIGAAVARIEELKNKYFAMILEITDRQLHIEKEIESLDSIERVVVRLKYFDLLTWDEICKKLGKTWRQIRLIHEKSLEKLSSNL